MDRTLRGIALFEAWPEEELQGLLGRAREVHVEAGEAVIRQGQVLEGLYVILAGSIEVGAAQRDGRRYIRRYAQPGTVFGFMSVFDAKGSPYSYVAEEASRVLFIDKPAFLGALARHPELWPGVAQLLAQFQRVALDAMEEHMFESLQVRLARAVLSLAKAYGTSVGANGATGVRITQDNLAGLLGVTRQSVSKELKRLEHDGLIRIEYGGIALVKRATIERIVRDG